MRPVVSQSFQWQAFVFNCLSGSGKNSNVLWVLILRLSVSSFTFRICTTNNFAREMIRSFKLCMIIGKIDNLHGEIIVITYILNLYIHSISFCDLEWFDLMSRSQGCQTVSVRKAKLHFLGKHWTYFEGHRQESFSFWMCQSSQTEYLLMFIIILNLKTCSAFAHDTENALWLQKNSISHCLKYWAIWNWSQLFDNENRHHFPRDMMMNWRLYCFPHTHSHTES